MPSSSSSLPPKPSARRRKKTPTAPTAPLIRLITQEESWRAEVNESVIELLEDLLERAKAGEFTGMAVAATIKDGQTMSAFSNMANIAPLIGAIVRMQMRIADL